MKNFKVITMAFLLLVGTVASAATEPVNLVKSETSKEIGTYLEEPNFLVEKEEVAFVTFVVNQDKEMVVLSVDTNNHQVERYLKNRLNYQKLNSNLKCSTEYKVPIRITSSI